MAEQSAAAYRAIRHDVAWRVVARDAVVIEGADATDWLQGQLSQDLASLGEAGASAETLVLSPQGRIDSYCRVTKLADNPPRYLLDLKAGAGMGLHERLRRFRLRVKASVEMLDDLHVLEQRGPASTVIAGRSVEGGGQAVKTGDGLAGVADVGVSWACFAGRDWLFTGDPSRVPSLAASLGLCGPGGTSAGIDDAFEAARIEAGVPELGRELTERTIPQEAGEVVARAVSFTKGCYTGQELVARIDARGSNTPRRLRGLVLAGHPAAGAAALSGSPVLKDGQQVGEVTSSAWSPGLEAIVALAYLKRGVEVPSVITVGVSAGSGGSGGSGGVPAEVAGEVRELPMCTEPAVGES